MDKQAAERRAHDNEKPRWSWLSLGIGASFVLVAVFSWFVLGLMGTIDHQHQQVVEATRQIIELRDELRGQSDLLNVLSSRGVSMVLLATVESNSTAYGKVIWNTETGKALLHVEGLPPSGPDDEYHVWYLSGSPKRAGVFAIDSNAPRFFTLKDFSLDDLPHIAGFTITREARGSIGEPKGTAYMRGKYTK